MVGAYHICGVSGALGPLLCRVVGQHLFLAGENAWLDPFGVTAGETLLGIEAQRARIAAGPLCGGMRVDDPFGHFLC